MNTEKLRAGVPVVQLSNLRPGASTKKISGSGRFGPGTFLCGRFGNSRSNLLRDRKVENEPVEGRREGLEPGTARAEVHVYISLSMCIREKKRNTGTASSVGKAKNRRVTLGRRYIIIMRSYAKDRLEGLTIA